MLRTILFFVVLLTVLIALLPLMIFLYIVRPFAPKFAGRIAFFVVSNACRLGRFVVGVKVEAKGLENLPAGETAVFVMNHRSIFDIIISYGYMPAPTAFVAKQELGRLPLFAWWLRLANCLFLNRTDIRKGKKTIEDGINNINNGISMCIFPEGTRNKEKDNKTSLMEFRGGAFKLATKTGVPVVPIVFFNSSDCFEDHMPKMKNANVKMIVLEPVRLENMDPKELRFLSRTIQEKMQTALDSCD